MAQYSSNFFIWTKKNLTISCVVNILWHYYTQYYYGNNKQGKHKPLCNSHMWVSKFAHEMCMLNNSFSSKIPKSVKMVDNLLPFNLNWPGKGCKTFWTNSFYGLDLVGT